MELLVIDRSELLVTTHLLLILVILLVLVLLLNGLVLRLLVEFLVSLRRHTAVASFSSDIVIQFFRGIHFVNTSIRLLLILRLLLYVYSHILLCLSLCLLHYELGT